ncbi:MAG: hypothetical protein ACXWJV_02695 [Hyphomicrobium sp.]
MLLEVRRVSVFVLGVFVLGMRVLDRLLGVGMPHGLFGVRVLRMLVLYMMLQVEG